MKRETTEFVTALERGLAVIRSFDRDHRKMTLTEVAGRTGLSRGTARRFLLTLQQLGYVVFDGKLFWPTPKVLQLGYAYMASLGINEVAKDAVRRVTEAVGESSSMAVLDGTEIVYVARVETRRIFSTGLDVGARLPAHASSLGRVLLAALDEPGREAILERVELAPFTARTIVDPVKLRTRIAEVRKQGYAIIDGELEIGIRSIAVPVTNRGGRTTAALNVSALAARMPLEKMRKDILPTLRNAAREVAQALDL